MGVCKARADPSFGIAPNEARGAYAPSRPVHAGRGLDRVVVCPSRAPQSGASDEKNASTP